MGKLSDDFYSAAKVTIYFYLIVFISIFLLVVATLFSLIYKERKETQEILVHIEQTYPNETQFVVQRGYYEGCGGSVLEKKKFIATVNLVDCKGVTYTLTDIHLREIDNKVYKFWLKYPFLLQEVLLG